jgi:hypothetical protein
MSTQFFLHSWMSGFAGFEQRFPTTLTPSQSQFVQAVWNQTNQSITQWFCPAPTLARSILEPFIPFSIDLITFAYNVTKDVWTQCAGLASVGTLLDERCGYYSLSYKILASVMQLFGVRDRQGNVRGVAVSEEAQRQGIADSELSGICLMAARRLQASYLPSFITEIDNIIQGLSGNASVLVQQDCFRGGLFMYAGAFGLDTPSAACGGPLLSLRTSGIRFMALQGINPFEVTSAFPTLPPAPTQPPVAAPQTVNVVIGGAVGGVVVVVAAAVIFRRVRRAPQSEVLLQAPSENLGFY